MPEVDIFVMNYNLTYAREPRIEHYDIPTGSMPDALMASKYESMDPDEDIDAMLDAQRRGILAYRGPDTPFLTSAEPSRRPGSYSDSIIGAWTNGHRGAVEADPYRPEEFYGFAGADDRDPRGTAIGPDFSKVHEESRLRSRFKRLGPEAMKPQIIDGAQSEARLVADKSLANWSGGRRIKVFDRQLVNAPSGARAKFEGVSVLERISAQNPRGEATSDNYLPRAAMRYPVDPTTATRKRGLALKTMTQDFGVANYGALRAAPKKQQASDPMAYAEADGEFDQSQESNETARRRAIVLTMAGIVREREQKLAMTSSGGAEMEESRTQNPISRRPGKGDLAALVAATDTESDWGTQAGLKTRAQKLPGDPVTSNPHAEQSHTADYVLHNAQMFYKAAKYPEDASRIREKMIVDRHIPDTSEGSSSRARKSMKLPESRGGANLLAQMDHEQGQSKEIKSYGGIKLLPSGGTEKFVQGSVVMADGHNTPFRSQPHKDVAGNNNPHVEMAGPLEDTRMRHFRSGYKRGSENARQFLASPQAVTVGEGVGEF